MYHPKYVQNYEYDSALKDRKLHSSLTLLYNPQYLQILYTIGKSQDYLSISSIKNEMKINNWLNQDNEKDIYRKIEKLYPRKFVKDKTTFLFDWNELKDIGKDLDLQEMVLKKLKFMNLDWLNEIHFTEIKADKFTKIKADKYRSIYFRRKDKKEVKLLVISYFNKRIEVKIYPEKILSYFDGETQVKSFQLLTDIYTQIMRIYIKKINPDGLPYIFPILDEQTKEQNSFINKYYNYIKDFPLKLVSTFDFNDIEQQMMDDRDVMKIMGNHLYYKYRLNFMGILLYILMEFYQTKQKTQEKMQERILQVISNPRIIDTAPFLKYWSDFNMVGFPIFNILFKIVMDFKNHIVNDINYTSKRFLILQINGICLTEVNRYFGSDLLSPFTFLSKDRSEKYKKLNISDKVKEYKNILLEINETLLKNELEELESYNEQQQMQ